MKTLFYFGILTILLSLNVKAQSFGNALQYDGVDDYVNFGHSPAFDVSTTVTYEAWIKPDSGAAGFIFNKWVGFLEDKQFVLSGERIHFYLFDAFGGTFLSGTLNVPYGEYTHIAATYDASIGTAKLYVNGVFDTSKTVGSYIGNATGNLFMGHNADRTDVINPYEGIIDEFRIWNVARTETEIQSTMNQTLNGNEAGLIGYWKFDEGTGTITYDATSNHNDGTISGATWVISGVLPVEQTRNGTPQAFSLEQNYPNPFNPTTKISWQSPVGSHQTLKVYDVLGNEVATLVDEYKAAGRYEVEFDASGLASGIYFYRIQAGSFVETKKMILLK